MKDRFGKKRIVVVEDELINRMMLVKVLEDEYELFEAGTGEEALSLIRENADSLSLVLLDLNLPDMSGMDILREIKSSEELQLIPVIVITADREAEVDSLNIGASDFIPKPYPKKEVIHARVKRTIELSEDRVIIGKTERDDVTGLFTREFFYSYAEQFDTRNKGLNTDAIAVNINHFRMINERFGKAYGDEILGRIGSTINRIADECGGLACRRDADNFFIYCLHRDDYSEMLERITEEASYGDNSDNVIRLRMGIYPDTDKTLDIERRFDRAKLAADTVKSTFTMGLAIYDSKFHQTQMFEEQLLMDFQSAIDEEQFKLYFQPKYNIRGDEPVLSSAEALIRWDHPELGMISPGAFIGTFEREGLFYRNG